jgi:hypothetical protein
MIDNCCAVPIDLADDLVRFGAAIPGRVRLERTPHDSHMGRLSDVDARGGDINQHDILPR